MRNKLFKYIKLLISVILILSLVAPSYASLSASDGSAFVTKAEFDSALADFNSRLTTFEAGINSKIDSQVTTYLDRNGIWNAKVQTLKNNSNGFTLINWDSQATGYAFYVKSWAAGNAISTKEDKLGKDPYFTCGDAEKAILVDSVSKTGLAMMNYRLVSNNLISYVWVNPKDVAGNTSSHMDHKAMVVSAFFKVGQTYGEALATWSQTLSLGPIAGLVFCDMDTQMILFFVQKGQPIYLWQGGVVQNSELAFWDPGEKAGIKTVIDSLAIY